MGKIYTIYPFINADSIPKRETIQSVISDCFYLFNIYSRNPYIIRDYMEFIDGNFDNAFSKLGYEIKCYKYPDQLEDDESEIIDFINIHYGLTGDCQLDICYKANKETVTDFATGRKLDIYFNDYAYYDTKLMGYDIISDPDNEIFYLLMDEIKYFRNNHTKETINAIIMAIIEYQSQLDYFSNGADIGNSELISNALLTLCQLKAYVKELLQERWEQCEYVFS